MRGGANHFFNGALCTMTLDVCIIAATAHFSGLKNWLPVLHVHVYGTLYAIALYMYMYVLYFPWLCVAIMF